LHYLNEQPDDVGEQDDLLHDYVAAGLIVVLGEDRVELGWDDHHGPVILLVVLKHNETPVLLVAVVSEEINAKVQEVVIFEEP